jgi:hypothetical protein
MVKLEEKKAKPIFKEDIQRAKDFLMKEINSHHVILNGSKWSVSGVFVEQDGDKHSIIGSSEVLKCGGRVYYLQVEKY